MEGTPASFHSLLGSACLCICFALTARGAVSLQRAERRTHGGCINSWECIT
jgi:hypothetical protein